MTFKDVNDLSEKIKRVLKDQKLREKLEAGARKYAEVAKLHLSLYEDTIKRSRLGGKS
jgi:glycosyltransferase involved in cell wall biosynthesis